MAEVRDPTGTARFAIVASWLWLAIDIALAMAALNTIRVLGGLGGPIASLPQLDAADLLSGILAVLYTLAFIVAGVAVLRWVYVTSRNAHAWSDHLTSSPGWGVGWFFIPFANWWKPYEGVRETWQASVDPDVPSDVPTPAVMRWWWAAWVIVSILGNVGLRLSFQAETADQLITADWFNVATAPIDLALTVALTGVIRRTTAVQRERLGAGMVPPLAPAMPNA